VKHQFLAAAVQHEQLAYGSIIVDDFSYVESALANGFEAITYIITYTHNAVRSNSDTQDSAAAAPHSAPAHQVYGCFAGGSPGYSRGRTA
jgi:hypothetical protein